MTTPVKITTRSRSTVPLFSSCGLAVWLTPSTRHWNGQHASALAEQSVQLLQSPKVAQWVTMEKPDPGKAQEKREKIREEQAELDEVEVMGFHLKLKDGAAVVGDKPKKGNEDTLKKKYGDQQYEKVKATFEESLKAWKDKEDELNSRAFGMDEDFRPNIPSGQKGWGRKGQLRLDTIKSAVSSE